MEKHQDFTIHQIGQNGMTDGLDRLPARIGKAVPAPSEALFSASQPPRSGCQFSYEVQYRLLTYIVQIKMPRRNPVGRVMEQWREANWPPKHLSRHQQIALYYGNHDAVAELSQSLREAMGPIADHIIDHCGGYKPRWLAIPKIAFGVKRVNLLSTTGKASRTFTSVNQLVGFCGGLDEGVRARMDGWLQSDSGAVLVAHKPILDMRAYIFKDGIDQPVRERFLRTGLVLAVAEGFLIQDHCRQHRDKRSDALTDAFATTASGWTIFPKIRAALLE